MNPCKEYARKGGHGGKRAGSGRKATGTHRLGISTNNETRRRLFTIAEEHGFHPNKGMASCWDEVFRLIFERYDQADKE